MTDDRIRGCVVMLCALPLLVVTYLIDAPAVDPTVHMTTNAVMEPARVGQHPCDQASDLWRKQECKAELRRVQRQLQQIERLAMPVF